MSQQVDVEITMLSPTVAVDLTSTVPSMEIEISGLTGSGGNDKHFEQAFSAAASVTVTHNLGKMPAVTVIDSAGDECVGDVEHSSVNEFTVTFSSAFSGVVLCN